MKALDASALALVLEGDTGAKTALRSLRGHEVATTEVAMLELALLARQGPKKVQAARRDVLERLRQKLTVLPIDSRASGEGLRRARGRLGRPELLQLAEWGALEAAGCEEIFTASRRGPTGNWRLKVTRISGRRS